MEIKLPTLRLGWANTLLTLSVLLAYSVVAALAYVRGDVSGLGAAAVAAIVCWAVGTVALVITCSVRGSQHAVAGTLVAGSVRFGLPLVAGLILQGIPGELAERGIFGWIVVFYLQVLAIETTLSVLVVRKSGAGSNKGS